MRNLLSHLTIRTKIIIAFAFVFSCTVGVGLISIQKLGGVTANAADVRDNWLPSVRVLGQLSERVQQLRALEAAHIFADSDAERATVDADMKATLDALGGFWKTYEPMISPGEEKRLADEFTRKWDAYLGEHAKLIEISRKNDDKAAAKLFETMGSGFASTMKTLDQDAQLNTENGRKAADDGQVVARSAHI